MKKKALLASVLTIALCISLIAGSTYALFTNEDEFDITVQAGTVDVFGYVNNLELYSVEAAANGTEVDENGNTYNFVGPLAEFTNTGTATFNNALLEIDRITPGDKVRFEIKSDNTGNVAAQTRFTIDCVDGYRLMEGLVIRVLDANLNVIEEYESVDKYTSVWTQLPKGGSVVNGIIEIELPVDRGNEYQNLGTDINVLVEAVQSNGVVENVDTPTVEYINYANDADELKDALASDAVTYVMIDKDVTAMTVSGNVSSKTIDVQGNSTAFVFEANAVLDDVTISNIAGDYAGTAIQFKSSASGEVTLSNCVFNNNTKGDTVLLGGNDALTLNVEDSTFNGGKYAIRATGAVNSVIIENTTFANKSGWAIMLNNAVNGDVVVNECEFINCTDGLVKVLSGVGGDFTFTNNLVDENCQGHDDMPACFIESTSTKGTPIKVTGTVTFTGNYTKADDRTATWVPAAGNLPV